MYLSDKTLPTNSLPQGTFSISRAYKHLEQIAREPHPTGSEENARVRSYIETTCKNLGLKTEILHGTGIYNYGSGIISGEAYNIVARIKGQNNSRAVLVSSHYDSQSNTPGAGDAGSSCAAMLETARLLVSGKPTRNDIIFLFTDAEELGLLGARAFASGTNILSEVGVALNFDAGGNTGVSAVIETNQDNGWIIKEYSKSGAHHFSSSMHYEIKKRLPNSTDFSIFKMKDIAGLNHSFYEGKENYHSMTDNVENLDPKSFQMQGENMFRLTKHFGDLEIRKIKAPDNTYFNLIGDWLVLYPASYELFFFILANILLLACIYTGFARNNIGLKGFIAGIGIYVVVLILLYFMATYFFSTLYEAYPMYKRFYFSSIYNANYYTTAVTALAIAVFTIIYQFALRKFTVSALVLGVLVIGTIMLDLLYFVAPMAIFLFSFPLIFVMISYLLPFWRKTNKTRLSFILGNSYLVFLLPALLILPPPIFNIFKALGIGEVSAFSVILIALLAGLLIPVFDRTFRINRYLIPGLAFCCFCIAMVLAHVHSDFTEKRPLQTSVFYFLDKDKEKASWVSSFNNADKWNQGFFKELRTTDSMTFEYTNKGLISDAPLLRLSAPEIVLKKDTIENGIRKLYLHCRSDRNYTDNMHFYPDKGSTFVQIEVNGKTAEPISHGASLPLDHLMYYGYLNDGFDVVFGFKPNVPIGFSVVTRSRGIPELPGFNNKYPAEIIPSSGYFSNSTHVLKHFNF